MTSIAQTTMMAAALALLVYIAVIATGIYTSQNVSSPTTDDKILLAEQTKLDLTKRQQIANNLNYIHKADTTMTSLTVPLHGVNLSKNQFILLSDSTPYATKGHIALNMPCDVSNPSVPEFEVLVGRAPDLASLTVGYIPQISIPPQMCVYHGQFGFGDPVTDIILKNTSNRNITLGGPHSVTISAHESYIPTIPSFEQMQHKNTTATLSHQ